MTDDCERSELLIPQRFHRVGQRRLDRLKTYREERNPKGRQARR